MKYQNIVNDLNNLFDSASREQHKREHTLKAFLRQFTSEEQKLRKKLNKASNDHKRSKLKKELDLVKAGYKLLDSNLPLRHA